MFFYIVLREKAGKGERKGQAGGGLALGSGVLNPLCESAARPKWEAIWGSCAKCVFYGQGEE